MRALPVSFRSVTTLATAAFALAGARSPAQATWASCAAISARSTPMVYDAARQVTVMQGGYSPNYLGDTWEWDGIGWTQRVLFGLPVVGYHALAQDEARQRTVLFGGAASGLGVLDDTWTWDGTAWTRLAPAARPPARGFHAMAYDRIRRAVVLFGGYDANHYLGDTWEWDGTDWTRQTPAVSPGPRDFHALAYDGARGRVLLFGGWDGSSYLQDTWEWDGTTWTQLAPATVPPGRFRHALAFDSQRNVVVLFGGDGPSAPLGDTWEWNGADWKQITSATTPPLARSGHGIAYDEARHQTVLTGGQKGFEFYADTWTWDGVQWTQRTAAVAPVVPSWRASCDLAYDMVRRRTVLFGGSTAPGVGDETWEWDGTRWLEQHPARNPPPRTSPRMAYDSRRMRTILFGGATTAGTANDTWEWDGRAWTESSTVHRPPARDYPALAYDESRAVTVMFGGSGVNDTWEYDGTDWTLRTPVTRPAPGLFSLPMAYDTGRRVVVLFVRLETWEWDGVDWKQVATSASPPLAINYVMGYDRARGRCVMFGSAGPVPETWEWNGSVWALRTTVHAPSSYGNHAAAYDAARSRMVLLQTDPLAGRVETWEYHAPCDVVAPGHPGGGITLACASTPVLGRTFCLTFPSVAGVGVLVFGPAPCAIPPLALQPPLMCAQGFLHASPRFALVATGDPASFCFPLPADLALEGASLCVQGLAAQPAACLRATDAVVVTLQKY